MQTNQVSGSINFVRRDCRGSPRRAPTSAQLWATLIAAALASWLLANTAAAQQTSGLVANRFFEVVPIVSSSTVFSTAQDANGFLWLATPEGLFRYDGQQMLRLDSVPGFSQQPVTPVLRVLPTRAGDLWWVKGAAALTEPDYRGAPFVIHRKRGISGVARCAAGVCEDIALPLHPAPWVWSLAEAPNGDVWLGTSAGLLVWHAGTVSPPEGPGPWPQDLVTALAFASDGGLWVGGAQGLTHYREGVQLEQVSARPVLDVMTTEGGMFATLQHGFAFLQPGQPLREFQSIGSAGVAPQLDGSVWTAAASRLVRYVAGQPTEVIYLGPSAPLLSLRRDREGSFWLGTLGGGVLQVRPRRLTNFGKQEGLPGTTAFSVIVDRANTTWVSSDRGIAAIRASEVTNYLSGQTLPGWGPRSLAQGPDGSIWALVDRGLVHFENDRFVTVKVPSGEKPRALGFDPQGALWLALPSGIMKLPAGASHAEGGPVTLTQADGVCEGAVTVMASAASGPVFVGHAHGAITTITGGEARCQQPSAAADGDVVALLAEEGEGLWVSRRNVNGLSYIGIHGESGFAGVDAGLPDEEILGLLAMPTGHVWLATEGGLMRVQKSDLLHAALSHTKLLEPRVRVDRRDGLRSPLAIGSFPPNLAADQQGRVWLASMLGAAAVEPPERWPAATVRPLIDEIRVDGSVRATRGEISLDPGRRNLEVRYAAPSFVFPQALRFEHRLMGLDSNWHATGTSPAASYPSLLPGRYDFQVRVLGPDGQAVGNLLSLRVVASPSLTERPLFYVVVLGLMLGLAALLYRFRVRQIQTRLTAVLDERRRIARDLHDGMSQGFTSLGFILDGIVMRFSELPAGLAEQLARGRRVLDHLRADARRALWDLRSPGIEAMRFREVLEQALVPLRLGAQVELQVEGEPAVLPRTLLHHVPLVVAEAAANAVRHGGANRIVVVATFENGRLRVRVHGEGQGEPRIESERPETVEAAKGQGIANMKDRASRMGGTFCQTMIENRLVVNLEVPYKRDGN